jgi:HAD superfamily hydrolase (TIGR01549 family)
MIRALIFDYGSVLSRTLDPRPRATWEKRLGLEAGELQRVVHNDTSWVEAQYGRLPVEAYWIDVGRRLGLTPQETGRLRTDFYRADCRNDELVTYIAQMRSAGLQTAVLSNFSVELRIFLEQQDLLQHFDQIAISAEIGVMKPAPKAYQEVLRMLDLPTTACVFVDDQPVNIDAAQALGMHGIVFRDNPSCIAQLNRLLAIPR